ncbi:conserved hypothetical protein [Ricinus communis]|uniref:Uncharacterized protein n=1 Tax=Ricinus communis TaxID=3988 RepID=B9TA69_RICCO|nr:conserved hypothetical protein [Ricinus communis]
MTASKRNIYTVMVIPDCVPEKVAYLKGRALSLYDKQVNGAGAWRTERFIKPFLASTP